MKIGKRRVNVEVMLPVELTKIFSLQKRIDFDKQIGIFEEIFFGKKFTISLLVCNGRKR